MTTFLLLFRINQLEGTKEILRIKRRIALQFASLVVYCIVVLTPDAISSFVCYGGGGGSYLNGSLSNTSVMMLNSILAADHSIIGIITFGMIFSNSVFGYLFLFLVLWYSFTFVSLCAFVVRFADLCSLLSLYSSHESGACGCVPIALLLPNRSTKEEVYLPW
jgi:hypothetical protein